MMKFLRSLIGSFCVITVCVLVLCAFSVEVAMDAAPPKHMLSQILLAGFVTALVTTVAYSRELRSKKAFVLTVLLHYAALCVIMIPLGIAFGWIAATPAGALGMALDVALVYAATFAVEYLMHKKEADRMNEAIRARNAQRGE